MKIDNIEYIESRAMSINLIPIFIMGASGLLFGYLAGSSAIMLDGAFSTVIFLTVILAKKISKVANVPRTHKYPRGRYLLESLYILFKIVVLMTILIISMGESAITLYEYYFHSVIPEAVNTFYANMYYVVKLTAFAIALIVYKYYLKQCDNKSNVLLIETKSVIIDGTITIAIFLGFFILGNFKPIEDVVDSIILLCISIFLFKEVMHSFKEQLNKTLGKRDMQSQEIYYKSMFNNYFSQFEFIDVYIFYLGKACTVSIIGNFEGEVSVNDLVYLEHEIKKLMSEELGKVYLYLYWDKRGQDYKKFLEEKQNI